MDKPQIIIEDNPAKAARATANIFVRSCLKSISKRGRFAVGLSGGSTPRLFHRVLAKEPIRSEIQWDGCHIFWVDDRCVPEDNPASNYGTAKKDLLDRIPLPPGQIHPMPGDLPPTDGLSRYRTELIGFFGLKNGEFPVFDLIVLGVGKDGHVASLFPDKASPDEKDNLLETVKGGDPYLPRLTMTYPVLNHARQIVFLVTGIGKAPILKMVFEDSHALLPAKKISPSNGRLVWILDRAAASLLPAEIATSQ